MDPMDVHLVRLDFTIRRLVRVAWSGSVEVSPFDTGILKDHVVLDSWLVVSNICYFQPENWGNDPI